VEEEMITSHKVKCKKNIKCKTFCGECSRNISLTQKYVTCKNCTLDFHIDCIDSSLVDSCIDWFCNSCFIQICNKELPFGAYIDLNCKLQKGFKVVHLNIQSIVNKLDYVEILLHSNNIDVFCVSETWTTTDIDDSQLKIDGYDFFRLDRSNEKTHGGDRVMCYVKENLSFKQNVDIHDDGVEGIFVEINLPNTKSIIVGTVYHPPDSTVDYI